mmetsp:Transcript_44468/g.79697  ORF Transcript_44468/g.79697 Transcript_44468/m.79697 type:complete len:2347 (-) Transcript_44468:219-7259(-)
MSIFLWERRIDALGENFLKVSWHKPASEEPEVNAPELQTFKVRVEGKGFWHDVDVDCRKAYDHTVDGLAPGSVYLLSTTYYVKPHDALGEWSPWQSLKIVTCNSPVIHRIYTLSSDHVRLRWMRLNNFPEKEGDHWKHADSLVSAYVFDNLELLKAEDRTLRYQIKLTERKGPYQLRNAIMVEEEDNALLLSDLHPDTEYTMAIRSQHAYPGNLRRWGEWSPTVGFITRPELELKCSYFGPTSVRLRWGRMPWDPERKAAMGEVGLALQWSLASSGVESYSVSVYEGTSAEGAAQHFKLGFQTDMLFVEGLQPGTTYQAVLTYADELHTGQQIAPLSVTTLSEGAQVVAVPSDTGDWLWSASLRNFYSTNPMKQVWLVHIGECSIMVSWIAEEHSWSPQFEGKEFEYRLRLLPAAGGDIPDHFQDTNATDITHPSVLCYSFSTADNTVVLDNLTPDTRYWIKGSAHNKVSGEWFEWTPVEAIVTACPPVVHLVDIHASAVTVDLQYTGSKLYTDEESGTEGVFPGRAEFFSLMQRYQTEVTCLESETDVYDEVAAAWGSPIDLSDLGINSSYRIRVRRGYEAATGALWGVWSNATYVAFRALPSRITGLTDNSISVAWDNPVETATGQASQDWRCTLQTQRVYVSLSTPSGEQLVLASKDFAESTHSFHDLPQGPYHLRAWVGQHFVGTERSTSASAIMANRLYFASPTFAPLLLVAPLLMIVANVGQDFVEVYAADPDPGSKPTQMNLLNIEEENAAELFSKVKAVQADSSLCYCHYNENIKFFEAQATPCSPEGEVVPDAVSVVHRFQNDAQCHGVISGLQASTHYVVQVKPWLSFPEGDHWGQLTAPTVLLTQHPLEFRQINAGETSMEVSWFRPPVFQPPEVETLGRVFAAPEIPVSYLEHVYNLTQVYHLRLRLAGFENDHRKPHIVKADSRDHVFWRLAPETEYVVDIRQQSYDGLTVPPVPCRMQTLKRLKYCITEIGESFVNLQFDQKWQEELDHADRLVEVQVSRYSPKRWVDAPGHVSDEEPDEDEDQDLMVGGSRSQPLVGKVRDYDLLCVRDFRIGSLDSGICIIDGLEPGEFYAFSVRTQMSYRHFGPWYAPVYIATACSIQVRISDISPTTAIAQWRRPYAEGSQGLPYSPIAVWHIKLEGELSTEDGDTLAQVYQVPADVGQYVLTRLNPDTPYYISVRASFDTHERLSPPSKKVHFITMFRPRVVPRVLGEHYLAVQMVREDPAPPPPTPEDPDGICRMCEIWRTQVMDVYRPETRDAQPILASTSRHEVVTTMADNLEFEVRVLSMKDWYALWKDTKKANFHTDVYMTSGLMPPAFEVMHDSFNSRNLSTDTATPSSDHVIITPSSVDPSYVVATHLNAANQFAVLGRIRLGWSKRSTEGWSDIMLKEHQALLSSTEWTCWVVSFISTLNPVQVSIKEVGGGYIDMYCTKGTPDCEGAICSPRYELMVNGCPCDDEVQLESNKHVLISMEAMEHLHTYTLYARNWIPVPGAEDDNLWDDWYPMIDLATVPRRPKVPIVYEYRHPYVALTWELSTPDSPGPLKCDPVVLGFGTEGQPPRKPEGDYVGLVRDQNPWDEEGDIGFDQTSYTYWKTYHAGDRPITGDDVARGCSHGRADRQKERANPPDYLYLVHDQGARDISKEPEAVKFSCREDRAFFGKEGCLVDRRVPDVIHLTYTYIPPENLQTIVKTPPLCGKARSEYPACLEPSLNVAQYLPERERWNKDIAIGVGYLLEAALVTSFEPDEQGCFPHSEWKFVCTTPIPFARVELQHDLRHYLFRLKAFALDPTNAHRRHASSVAHKHLGDVSRPNSMEMSKPASTLTPASTSTVTQMDAGDSAAKHDRTIPPSFGGDLNRFYSPYSPAVNYRIPPPPGPLMDFKAVEVTETSLLLRWCPHSPGLGHQNQVMYLLTIGRVKDKERSVELARVKCGPFKLGGLTPDTSYRLGVRTCSTFGSGPESIITVRTMKPPGRNKAAVSSLQCFSVADIPFDAGNSYVAHSHALYPIKIWDDCTPPFYPSPFHMPPAGMGLDDIRLIRTYQQQVSARIPEWLPIRLASPAKRADNRLRFRSKGGQNRQRLRRKDEDIILERQPAAPHQKLGGVAAGSPSSPAHRLRLQRTDLASRASTALDEMLSTTSVTSSRALSTIPSPSGGARDAGGFRTPEPPSRESKPGGGRRGTKPGTKRGDSVTQLSKPRKPSRSGSKATLGPESAVPAHFDTERPASEPPADGPQMGPWGQVPADTVSGSRGSTADGLAGDKARWANPFATQDDTLVLGPQSGKIVSSGVPEKPKEPQTTSVAPRRFSASPADAATLPALPPAADFAGRKMGTTW